MRITPPGPSVHPIREPRRVRRHLARRHHELMVEIGALNVGLDRLTRRAATRLLAGPALGSRPHGDGESTRF
jgi:hypothetical protein